MAIPVLVLGETGTGKTNSTKSFNSDDVKILSVHKPVLSYRDKGNKKEFVKTPTAKDIIREMKNTANKLLTFRFNFSSKCAFFINSHANA